MITKEEIEVLVEFVKGQYDAGVIDSDILFLLTKLIVEKENELENPIKDIKIEPIKINEPYTSPSIYPYPWRPYDVWYDSNHVKAGEDAKFTTTTTSNL